MWYLALASGWHVAMSIAPFALEEDYLQTFSHSVGRVLVRGALITLTSYMGMLGFILNARRLETPRDARNRNPGEADRVRIKD